MTPAQSQGQVGSKTTLPFPICFFLQGELENPAMVSEVTSRPWSVVIFLLTHLSFLGLLSCLKA